MGYRAREMSNRRALRAILTASLGVPASIVFESARAVAPFCPEDVRGPHGALRPSALTVGWHVLGILSALPVLQAFNKWPDGRTAGLAQRAKRLSELVPMNGLTVIHGHPPRDALAIAASGLPLLQSIEQLFKRLLTPDLFDALTEGNDLRARQAGPLLNRPGVVLTIHGGREHMFATLRFRFTDGATLQTAYRHPEDEDKAEPNLVVRVSIGLDPLARLAATALGVPHMDEFETAPAPVAAPAPPVPAPGIPLPRYGAHRPFDGGPPCDVGDPRAIEHLRRSNRLKRNT